MQAKWEHAITWLELNMFCSGNFAVFFGLNMAISIVWKDWKCLTQKYVLGNRGEKKKEIEAMWLFLGEGEHW